MLSLLIVILLSFFISIDGYVLGFSLGLKRIRIPLLVVVLMAFFTSFVILLAMGIGQLIGDFIPTNVIKTLGGILMIFIGIYHFIHKLPSYSRSYFLIITLFMNVDSFGYGIQAGVSGRSFSFPLIAGFLLFMALLIGIMHGYETRNRMILRYISFLPSLLFIFLGITKLLF